MRHIVLLGDSVLDNAAYVPAGHSVVEHVQRRLSAGDRVTLLAVDGAVVASVFDQLVQIPEDATHLVLSVGGNNALAIAGTTLSTSCSTVREALAALGQQIALFAADYARLLSELGRRRLPLTACTIYDSVPGLDEAEKVGLSAINGLILRLAFAAGVDLLDLRLLCQEPDDYADCSPIEPSSQGGEKIASAIDRLTAGDAADVGVWCRVPR